MLFNTTTADVGLRLDVFLCKQLPQLSRARIQTCLAAQGDKASRTIKAGETICLSIPETKPNPLEPQDLPLEILYQDDDLIVINKPAGLVVHPGAGNPDKTLVNALLHHFPGLVVGDTQRPGIVHRLDKNTSGIMLIARHDQSHRALSLAFKNRAIRKIYRAFCVGTFKCTQFSLETGHQRHPIHRKRYTTRLPTQRMAISKFEVLPPSLPASFAKLTMTMTELRIEILTGRTHQIRAQLADIGHPILGDTLYGGPKIPGFDRHALHAEEIFLIHPTTGKPMHFISPSPL